MSPVATAQHVVILREPPLIHTSLSGDWLCKYIRTYAPVISLKPSMTSLSSSGEIDPIFLPMRSVLKVLI